MKHFSQVDVGDKRFQTETCGRQPQPTWTDEFSFEMQGSTTEIRFTVYNEADSRCLGEAVVDARRLSTLNTILYSKP